ncbi:polysaccharide deacetylase family protein [Cuneatibacter caecimuris]|uniref:Polysaccharide deacetylase n=1 Tax=Cuneatibacter caecimuris TaxID=1796618 RepID=A0A4V2F5Y9_9FIRM|nr:polysaccharide deacetylase [Cuneatibacter caecimuris]RZS94479.1 hypothetical protein EV209_2322 [Cuneatibacter caecimuris]
MVYQSRYKRRRRRVIRNRIIVISLLVVSVALIGVCIKLILDGRGTPASGPVQNTGQVVESQTESAATETTEAAAEEKQIMKEAELLFAQYDPDAAVEKIKSYAGYASVPEMVAAINTYTEAKSTYVKVDVTKVTHVFYHTLIADSSIALSPEKNPDNWKDYNDAMTTMEEYAKIMQKMYDAGYVMVDIHELGHIETDANGNEKMVAGEIYLPPGKKAFVLSQDDVSYYEYMDGDGFASKLVIDENNNVVNEYKKADGTVVYGSYDMIPMTEDFVKEHPDFSYRGARGIIALTGYNGILGYRTSDSENGPNRAPEKTKWTLNPNIEADKVTAKQVADRLKELGWTFASHSFNHLHMHGCSDASFTADTDLWEKEVEPLIGETDVILYPFGEDPTGTWRPYDESNARINYLKQAGFRYFCTVDSNQYWVQISGNVFKQGRRNLDGYRLWEAVAALNGDTNYTDRLSDLFDAREVFDAVRPTPITHG